VGQELQSKCISLKHMVASLENALENKNLEAKKSAERLVLIKKLNYTVEILFMLIFCASTDLRFTFISIVKVYCRFRPE